jgi:hypothetical protein
MRSPRQVCGWAIGAWTVAFTLVVPATALAADTTPPTPPGPITVTGVTESSARLSWPNSVDDVSVVGYRVYRGPAAAADAALRLTWTTDAPPTYQARPLFSGTAYKFGIVAIDAANNASPMRTVAFTTAASSDSSAPVPPTSGSVSARAFSSSRIDLTWAASTSTDLAAYQVFRDGARVATVELPGAPRWSDNGLAARTAHSYVIKAVDAAGNVSAGTTGRNASTLAAGTAQIARGPYLSNVTGTSAIVSWWTNIPTPGVVSWGLASTAERSARDPAGSVLRHSVTIGGLTPGTTYRYQVGNGAGLVSAASRFRSASPRGQAFRFAVIGDFGGGSIGMRQNAADIAAAGTSFILTVGDNVYPSGGDPDPDFATTLSDFDARLYRPFGPALATQAFFPANGNKEYYGNGAFWANFPMPGSNHSWYGYDWGDAHILVLDTEHSLAPGTPQYAFAEADLAAHQTAAFRIVVVHSPPYSSSSATSSSVNAQQLVPLFQRQRVSLVLSGNSHNYERSHPLIDGVSASGGITYIVTGAGGNGINKFRIPAPARTAFREDAYYEYLRIGVAPTAMRIEAVRADTNTVFDSATITSPGAQGGRDMRKPGLRVRIKGRARLLTRRRLRVVVRTDERAAVAAAGRLRRIGAFRRARRMVPPAVRRVLVLRLGPRKVRGLRHAMRRHGRALAVLKVRARDAAGNETVVRRRMKIRRRHLICRQPRVCGRARHSSQKPHRR